MSVFTNPVMALATKQAVYSLNKIGVGFEPVIELRRCLREMAFGLDRDDERQGTLYRSMFSLISELQTSPVNFDQQFGTKIENLFDAGVADRAIWGKDIANNYFRAKSIAFDLMGELNPLVVELVKAVRLAQLNGQTFAVSCSRRDRQLFSHIMAESGLALSESDFVSSDSDFSQMPIVDILFRLGPLLSWGRGVAPTAILSAPKFCFVNQYIWAGTADDADFGDDALTEFVRSANRLVSPVATWEVNAVEIRAPWTKPIPQPVDIIGNVPSQDFAVFNRESGDLRSAKLICIDERLGMLWPPASSIVSYDPRTPADAQPVVLKAAGELERGQFVAYVKQIGQVDEHSNTVTEERSSLWKSALSAALVSDSDSLKRRLADNGLGLVSLGQQLRYWTEPPSTVIHAPQSEDHFYVLCFTLGSLEPIYDSKMSSRDFWKLAWDDIRLSRGEAISAGVDRNEEFDKHLLIMLEQKLAEKPLDTISGGRIVLELPSLKEGETMKVELYLVQELEDGFRAPASVLKSIREIDYFRTQWH